ncbi:MAG: AAA family ATPase [Acidobacteriota bacterium]|nr:AAA family ATPase [Acidobacteriota bacterium]
MQLSFPDIEVKEEIARSNSSVVLFGHRNDDGLPVVVKVLNSDYPSTQQIARFKYEYKLARKLEAPGLVHVHELRKHGNTLAILQDYGGVDLNRFPEVPLPLDLFFQIARDVTQTIARLHSGGIIHKDINPRNILWDESTRRAHIIDFGISTELTRERQKAAQAQELLGTLPYISPEQTGRINCELDYRTDFYSLGVTFYQLLTGALPFSARDAMGWVHCHIAKHPTDPRKLRMDLPDVLANILLKLMSKDPEARYQSAQGLLEDLKLCAAQWRDGGVIVPFELGRRDIRERFSIPDKLYGREKELERILTCFARVARGGREMISVGGYSGVGKSSLINEVHRPIVEKRGYFIEGKFDQYQRNLPYRALIQAFGGFIDQLLNEPREQQDRWRYIITDRLGLNTGLMTDLFPRLENLVGEQAPVPDLNPMEAQNRFLNTFRHFVGCFAHEEHPIVLFLDDVQWADIPSLKLVEGLMDSTELTHLLVIVAYRDNEVDDGHPLMHTLHRVENLGSLRWINIEPLRETSVKDIVADTLRCPRDECETLAQTVFQKTGGNPFFINELLKNLYREGCLTFNPDRGCWTWQEDAVESVMVSGDVVTFMISRLRKLPETTQNSLKTGACMGNIFDLSTLTMILDQSPVETAATLWPAVKEGILLPLSEKYRLVTEQVVQGITKEVHDFGVRYRFQHDRVQQAAYALIEPRYLPKTHLHIGRRIQSNTPNEKMDDNVIDIVRHLNEGRNLIKGVKEKLDLARLNLTAASKARASMAFEPALSYLGIGQNLLPENAWERHYELTFDIYRDHAETSYLCGAPEQARDECEFLLKKVRTDLQRAEICRTLLALYYFNGYLQEGIDAGLKGLRALGIDIDPNPTDEAVMAAELALRDAIGDRPIETLLDLPELTDPQIELTLRILMELWTPAYEMAQENLWVLFMLTLAELSVRYGNSPTSAFAYLFYGMILICRGELASGNEFGELSLKLNAHFNSLELRYKIVMMHTLFIRPWNYHWRTLTTCYSEVLEAAHLASDSVYIGYSCLYIIHWNPEINLEKAVSEGAKYLARFKATHSQGGSEIIHLQQAWRLNMRGATQGLLSLTTDDFDANACLTQMTEDQNYEALCCYHTVKLQLCFYYEHYDQGLLHFQKADELKAAMAGQIFSFEFTFFSFLVLAALHNQFDESKQEETRKRLREELQVMKLWADHCPINYSHHYLMMAAEMARVEGRTYEAADLYDQAIEQTRVNEYDNYRAIANELAAKFYLNRGRLNLAAAYFKDAHYYYSLWMAVVKARQLEESYGQYFLKPTKHLREVSTTETTQTSGSHTSASHNIDLEAVLRASQALSGEIVLEDLLKKLMHIAIESSGAQLGGLLTNEDGFWFIKAKGGVEDVTIFENRQFPLEQSQILAPSVIRHVAENRKPIVLSNAFLEGSFHDDPIIAANKTKSLLCMPIIGRGKMQMILYLTNNLIGGAFTEERIGVLTTLSSQAAISIENASLYANLEKKVEERTIELSIKNRQIMSSIQYAQRIQRSMLPDLGRFHELLPQSFVIYQPKDIVSGDFFWYYECEDYILVAVVDCTGHGVPGALMSMIGNTLLNQIVKENGILEPNLILTMLSQGVRRVLHQEGDSVYAGDGMELALCRIRRDMSSVTFAGARRPLFVTRPIPGKDLQELLIYKGDRNPVGGRPRRKAGDFSNHEIHLRGGETLYLTTDGFVDQPRKDGKKYGSRQFKALLSSLAASSMDAQKNKLISELTASRIHKWQRDDITIIGIRLSKES